jgi:3-deoxy-D-manno-octulosonic-acid transferase
MIWLYYLGFALVLSIAGPLLLFFKPKTRAGLLQKLGAVPASIRQKNKRRRIWFHTCSVGEFNASFSLIKVFKEKHPDCELFVSTTTATGQSLALEKVGAWAQVFYFPFDLPWCSQGWLSAIQPDVVAIAETEIWPGFIHECTSCGVAVCFINGRISPRSFKQRQRFSWLFSRTMRSLTAVAVQSAQEAVRYKELGVNPDSLFVCGNMKFDGMQALPQQEREELARSLNIHSDDDIVIVCGSTHEPEEAALLTAFKKLRAQFPNYKLKLAIAPRHPERFAKVAQIVESFGYRPRLYSAGQHFENENDVYVLDTIGQLTRLYSIAHIAFVGGTIAPIGGHNLVEPCIYEIPVVCGPHLEKTRDVAKALIERKALLKVDSPDQLAAVLSRLIESKENRLKMGAAGRAFVADSQGAVAKNLAVLESLLPKATHDSQKYPPMREGNDKDQAYQSASNRTRERSALK